MERGPLLQLLYQVLVQHNVVSRAVPRLHAGIRSVPGRLRLVHLLRPFIARLLHQPKGTALVRRCRAASGRAGEAARRHTRVARAGCKHVGVHGQKDVGHHATRRRPRR
jgi:hypothetical protein